MGRHDVSLGLSMSSIGAWLEVRNDGLWHVAGHRYTWEINVTSAERTVERLGAILTGGAHTRPHAWRVCCHDDDIQPVTLGYSSK
jgi:hypothetical protein